MTTTELDHIREHIREVPDFPKPGILFKDITPLLLNDRAFSESIDRMLDLVDGQSYHKVAAPEARGFIFGTTIALRLGVGFVPVRKPGKLPHETTSVTYDLEYGQDTVAMHTDAVEPGERVLLVDDVLATGGTMQACGKLIESRGASVGNCLFFMELAALPGRSALKDYSIHSLLTE